MNSANTSPIVYNQTLKDDETLKKEFVLRTKQFDTIFNDIRSSKMEHAEQQYLILGQRGSGKTTLLHRIKIAIQEDKKLNKILLPILLNEEQYSITELYNLWEEVAIYLEDNFGFKNLLTPIQNIYGASEYEQKAINILLKSLKNEKKKIILLIDNLNDLFKKLDEIEQRRLREILITCNDIRLIGASSRLWEALYKYDQPFMDFFKTIDLDALSNEDVEKQLRTLADIHGHKEIIEKIIKESPERINVLRILTGGVPRTIALLFQIFVDNEMNDSVKDLYAVVEAVTPLYKHRMDDLSTQHQKIVDAVAKFWDACSTAEIAEKTRMESKAVSAQLKVLEKEQIIEKVKTNNKNHLYRLRERFFNIWYLMRFGRANDKDRVIWLTKFLDSWCDKDDLKNRLQLVIENTKNNKIDKATSDMLLAALMQSKKIDIEDKLVIKEDGSRYGLDIKHQFDSDELFGLYLNETINKRRLDVKKIFQIVRETGNIETRTTMVELVVGILTQDLEPKALINQFISLLDSNLIQKRKIKINNIYLQIQLNMFDLAKVHIENNITIRIKHFGNHSKNFIADYLLFPFQLLIAKYQYHIVYNLFQTEDLQLKDRMKPIYYALMHFMKDEYPNEYLKMGSELKEPVDEIIEKILKMRELYA